MKKFFSLKTVKIAALAAMILQMVFMSVQIADAVTDLAESQSFMETGDQPPPGSEIPAPASAPAPENAAENDPIPDRFDIGVLKAEGQVSPKDLIERGGAVQFAVKIIDLFVKIVALLSLVVFMLGALLTIVSEGKDDRLEKGKSAMMFALIGLVISGFSFIIVTFVQSILF